MTTTVTVIDEIAVPRERVEEWSRRWRSDYLPGAGDRGMRVIRQCRGFTSADTVTLLIQWELPGIYEFYRMRAAAGADDGVSRFWQWTDSLAVARSRRVLEEVR
ncbi:hypothetical protein [Nocardia africana]|uniref:NIPSNAP n=1 Tax=Nocardia africana TaxID=134964 RepID=A0A378WZA2_9NOCA|nr:hypothetical protein [Nocardia africana]MCC3312470.1 hypothetical protein [Nocardia africana]SUA46212.1 Uncharacterised protein [Nocardia africana]